MARQDGIAEFALKQRDHDGKLIRAANRAEYFPVYFVAPYNGNEAALGFDLRTSPPRLATLSAARDNGVATASGRVQMVQAQTGQSAVLVVQPIYARGLPVGTIAERQQNLRGFVLAVFSMEVLVKHSVAHLGLSNIEIKIHDENGAPGEQLLFSTAPVDDENNDRREYGLRWVTTPKFAGRDWRIAISPSASAQLHDDSWQASTVLLLGTGLTTLLGAFILSMTGQSTKIERLVQESTAALSQINNLLAQTVDQHQLTEAKLHNSEARVSAVLQAAPNGIFTVDPQGNLESINRAAEAIFGQNARSLVGQPARSLFFGPHQSLFDNKLGIFEEPSPMERPAIAMEFHGQRSDGTTVPLLVTLSRVQLNDQALHIAIVHELSEQKQFQTELAQAKAAAEDSNRAKSEFLASMSHEIRTPMNAIIGMADLLKETSLNDEQREYVETFANAGEALLDLINDILDLSKVEARQLELEGAPFSIEATVEKLIAMLAVRAHKKGLELAYDISPDVPNGVVGDSARLGQIIVNLVGNAIKFTEGGEFVLTIAVDGEADPDHCQLHFTVRDTGMGIPADKLDLIFERFTQVDSSTTRRFGGTGLGLAICKKLVEMMDGRIWVESVVGQGSTFNFTARFGIAASADLPSAPRQQLAGLKALVVDDNPTNLMIEQRILESMGLATTVRASGSEGLAEMQRASAAGNGYDLLVLDREMPEMNGMVVAETLHAEPRLGHTKVLMYVSNIAPGDAARSQAAGVARVLIKPVRRRHLAEAIAGVLSAGHQAEPVPAQMPATTITLDATALRILIADDTPDNRNLIQAFLKKSPYQLDMAENGAIAVQKFTAGRYDLVLMDMQMPVMDGYDATRAIRQWEQQQGRAATPIVALTAHALAEDTDKSLQAGCTAHVTKPIKKVKLLETISQYAGGGEL